MIASRLRPHVRLLFVIFLCCTGVVGRAQSSSGVTLVIIGDSTVANYPAENVLRGWGQMLPEFLAPSTTVLNLARNGASTRTFLKLPNWKQALASKGDFLLIQFGHNDSHGPGHPEATTADGEYADNLRKMVADARAAGMTPILITPMHRRTFDKAGNLTHELQPYADAMKRVAADTMTPLIDLQQSSGELFTKLGDEASTDLNGPKDRTHFTEKGARHMAGLVAKELERCDPKLKAITRE